MTNRWLVRDGAAVASLMWPATAEEISSREEIEECNTNLLKLKAMETCGGPAMQHCSRNFGICAEGCQDAIDLVYLTCGGLVMTLYNHEIDWVSTEEEDNIGETVSWDDEVAPAVKLAVESCGCDGAVHAIPTFGVALAFVAAHLWR